MKILSIITGIGYGHAIRQAALLKFLKQKKIKIKIASYKNSYNYFKDKFPTLKILGPTFLEKSSKFKSIKIFLINLKLFYYYTLNVFRLRNLIKEFNPDFIISDFEVIPLYLSKGKNHLLIFDFDPEIYQDFIKDKKKKFILQKFYIDFLYKKAKKINCPVIIPSLLGEKKHKDFYYVNPIIREIPEESQKILLKKLKLKKQPIIIMLGGSEFGSTLLYKILSVIPDIDEQFLIFGYKITGKKNKNITFMPFKENFLQYLKASKGLITMAGHNTLSEAVILKKPSLIFPVPNMLEQLTNAYIMERNKLAIVKSHENISKKELKSVILQFLNNLEKLEKNLSKIDIKPNGAEQVYNIIKGNS